MSNDVEFSVVDDTLREPTIKSKYIAVIEAVLEGKTVFVPGVDQEKAAGIYTAVTRRGKKLRTRTKEVKGKTGLVMWAEEREEEEPTTS
jgi:hypothetical protein